MWPKGHFALKCTFPMETIVNKKSKNSQNFQNFAMLFFKKKKVKKKNPRRLRRLFFFSNRKMKILRKSEFFFRKKLSGGSFEGGGPNLIIPSFLKSDSTLIRNVTLIRVWLLFGGFPPPSSFYLVALYVFRWCRHMAQKGVFYPQNGSRVKN